MQKLHTYWHALQASIADPEYYFSLINTRVWFSIQFFLLTLFLITLSVVPRMILRDIPQVVVDVRTESIQIVEQLPADAAFSYEGEDLRMNGIALPLTIQASDRLQSLGYPKALVTLQATDAASLAALTITPKNVYLSVDESEPSHFSYTEFLGDVRGSVARDQIRSTIGKIMDEVIANRVAIATVTGIGMFVGVIFNGIFTILFYSLAVQIFGWIVGLRLRYRTAMRWGLHIYPIAYGIQEISRWTVRGSTFPILAVAYIAIALLIIWTGKRNRPTINL